MSAMGGEGVTADGDGSSRGSRRVNAALSGDDSIEMALGLHRMDSFTAKEVSQTLEKLRLSEERKKQGLAKRKVKDPDDVVLSNVAGINTKLYSPTVSLLHSLTYP